MSFKLSQQLDADSVTAFELYRKYIERNRSYFPESVLKLYENQEWQGGTLNKGPMDSILNRLRINIDENQIELELTKRLSGFKIFIQYNSITEYNIQRQKKEVLTWRYEQFRYIDSYRKYRTQEKIFAHDIEWTSGEIFTIEAKEINFKFIEK